MPAGSAMRAASKCATARRYAARASSLRPCRRWNSAATIGVGIIWTFPRGLIVPVSASLVVFNITTVVACDANIAIDE